MAWFSGIGLLESVINSVIDNVDDEEARKNIYHDVIEAFEGYDCNNIADMLDDVEDDLFKETYYELHPEQLVESDEDEE